MISGRENERAKRVKLAGAVLALVELENGRHVRARLHQLSTDGGILHLSAPLDEKLTVRLLFHVGSTTVRGQARMLFPMWSTRGCLQPFSFTSLGDEAREQLHSDLESLLGSQAESVEDAPESAPITAEG